MQVVNIASYKFIALSELDEWREKLLAFCQANQILGTIILSEEGINLNLAARDTDISLFTHFLTQFDVFSDMRFKYSYSENVPFQHMKVKLKSELTPLEQPGISLNFKPKYIKPTRLAQLMKEKKVNLLDTRNRFEYALGTFDGAIDLNLTSFREFPAALAQLDDAAKKEPTVIFCTGGIRCEKAAPVMEAMGFEEVYQLEGGILDYFAECGQDQHYHGDCFVFDERIALDAKLQPQTGDI